MGRDGPETESPNGETSIRIILPGSRKPEPPSPNPGNQQIFVSGLSRLAVAGAVDSAAWRPVRGHVRNRMFGPGTVTQFVLI